MLAVAAMLLGASCHSPTGETPKAPLDGVYNAVLFDDTQGPVRLSADSAVDLTIVAATIDFRLEGLAIFTTYMDHDDPMIPPARHIFAFAYRLRGDSIATDSGGVGGKRLQSAIRFTMKYVVAGSAGDAAASHTFILSR